MGKELEGGTQFNSAESSFKEFLEANLEETEINNFQASLFMNQEQRLARVHDLIERHELYKVNRNHASPRVQRAWEIIDGFMEGKAQYIKESGITPIIYGSATFDDPATFDFDLSFVGISENDELEAKLEAWKGELAASWKEKGIEGHITYTSLENLERYARAMQEDIVEVVDEEDYDIYLYLLYGSSVLIGNYAYSESELGNEFREKYIDIVKQSPPLLAYTIFSAFFSFGTPIKCYLD